MKAIKIFVFSLLFVFTAQAQAQVTVNVNMGNPPAWAPAKGAKAQYYYLPEIDAYYDVQLARFIYLDNAKWVRSEKLPLKFKHYDLRKGKIIYLTDYKGKSPYKYHKKHKAKYQTIKVTPGGVKVKTKGDNGLHKGHKKHKKAKHKRKHLNKKH
ncbi:hypothetical protein NLM59_08340 [Weeksellaceae bacterium KMM 9724]|uniref:hypothetical protein n=1 Tax=Profundicola chukchiensis TaxID=2961959 RepID=UPI002437B454|nr:hypothetical protein [Profundicola chukchiensis]MDG4950932.1 hypothetical protein [Profundicola chukchiensis]